MNSEYLPTNGENGNGHHNGNGNGKIFSLSPVKDPLTQRILDTRDAALGDPRLTRSMSAFFCRVLDRALNPTAPGFQCKGSISISDSNLGKFFRVSERTVYTWKKRLEALGYVWLSKLYKTNMEPITIYNITALIPPRNVRQDEDGTSQNGSVRTGFQSGMGARAPKQPSFPLPGSRSPKPPGIILLPPLRLKHPFLGIEGGAFHSKSDVLQGISGGSRNELPLSPDLEIGSEPKLGSAESRSKDRLRAEVEIGSEPILGSAQSRSELPPSAEADFRHKRDSDRRERHSERGGEGKSPPDGFERWQAGLGKMFPRELESLASDLRAKCKAATTPEAKQEWKRRIAAVEAQLYGGTVADAPAPAKRIVTQKGSPAPEEVLSPAEQAMAAQFAARLRKSVIA